MIWIDVIGGLSLLSLWLHHALNTEEVINLFHINRGTFPFVVNQVVAYYIRLYSLWKVNDWITYIMKKLGLSLSFCAVEQSSI